MSRRTERLSSLIRRVVAELIPDLGDPRVAEFASVTRVEISPDLSVAKVHVSVMGSESTARLTIRALQHAAGRIQAGLAKQVRLRVCPRLTFFLDESLKRGFEVVQLIEREMAELETRSPAVVDPADPGTEVQEAR